MILESDRLLTEELPGLRRLAENTPTICEEFHQEGGILRSYPSLRAAHLDAALAYAAELAHEESLVPLRVK